ncbi:MAG: hypothetical protein JNK53_03820 [Phycisphaerae bacterium]|nr:hypothetical protein [Phycisphaerae bacterium]
MSQAFLDCWPVLDRTRATALLDALVRSHPHWSAAARSAFEQSLSSARADQVATLAAWWRGAGSAGLLAALSGQNSQRASVAFATGAIDWLRTRVNALADASVRADSALVADLCDGWVAALDTAATVGGDEVLVARDGAALAAIEALLRSGAGLDRPGTPAAAMGTLLDAVPWTAGATRRDRVVEAWKSWMADATIASRSLHGMTSVLSARRPGPWWDPWLVVDARANAAERDAVAARLAPALGEASASTPVATAALRGVDPQLLRRWHSAATAIAQKPEPASDAGRVARTAEFMALVEAARLLERGRVSDADARLTQLEHADGLSPTAEDRWRDGPPSGEVRVPAADGTLENELRKPRALEDRLNVLRALRTRPIRDLGPRDAETIAREALTSPSTQMRSVAQAVIVDVFAQGPQVLGAVIAEVHACANASEAAQMAGALAGVAAPRGTDSAMRSAAALLVVDQLAGLTPSDRHALESVSRELALSASACARLLGAQVPMSLAPEQAMREWVRARTAEAQRIVPNEVLAEIINRPISTRHATRGGPQRYVADQTLLLDVDAAILVEHRPRRRTEILGVVQRAAASRAQAGDVFAQMDANARALVQLCAIALGMDRSEGGT